MKLRMEIGNVSKRQQPDQCKYLYVKMFFDKFEILHGFRFDLI